MPMPKIHQVVRAPRNGGQPCIHPGLYAPGWNYSSGAYIGGSTLYTRNPTPVLHGIANAWTVMFWHTPLQSSSTVDRPFFDLVDPANSNNRILIQIEGTEATDPLNVIITDSAGVTIKDYEYNSQVVTTNYMSQYVVTWDGTTLLAYRNGLEITANAADTDTTGTMTDTARGLSIMNNVAGTGTGQIGNTHMVGVWNTVLSANEIKSLHMDGPWACQANLAVDFDDYVSKDSLVHWYRPSLNGTTMGTFGHDYATGPSAVPFNCATISSNPITNYTSTAPTGTPRGNGIGFFSTAGGGEYLRNTTQTALGISSVFSIMIHMRVVGISGAVDRTLFEHGPSGSNQSAIKIIHLGTGANDPIQLIIYNSSGAVAKDYRWDFMINNTANTAPEDSVQIVFTVDTVNNEIKAYRNGRFFPPTTKSTDNSAATKTDVAGTTVISATKGGTNLLLGQWHSVAIWDAILTPCEVATLYCEGYPQAVNLKRNTLGYYKATNLKHWWRCNKRPGSTGAGTLYTVDDVPSGGRDLETNSAGLTLNDFLSTNTGGRTGTCVKFTATSGHALVNTTPQLMNIANEWTISVFVKVINSATNQDIFVIGVPGEPNCIRIFNIATSARACIAMYDEAGVNFKDYRYNNALASSVWRRLVWTWNGTTLQGYFLGAATTANVTSPNDAGTMTDTARQVVAAAPATLTPITEFMTGRLSEVAVWNRALTSAEVLFISRCMMPGASDFSRDFGAYQGGANLKHYWKFAADPNSWGSDFAGTMHLGNYGGIETPELHNNCNSGPDQS